MYVDFYSFSFRHLNAWPMALPTDDKWQCHPYLGQYVKIDAEVIPQYQIISLVLILLGVMFYIQCASGCAWYNQSASN